MAAMPNTATSTADASPELNPELDRARLAETFRQAGRVHIANALTNVSAERIYRCLVQETKWSLTFNKGTNFLDLANVSQEERSKLAFSAWNRARSDFQYFFDNHRLSVDGEPYPDQTHYCAKIVAFLNAPPMLDLIRDVTGLAAVQRTD